MLIRPLTQDDLRWLVCPVCHQALALSETGDSIRCTVCSRVYPVVDGLPKLIAS